MYGNLRDFNNNSTKTNNSTSKKHNEKNNSKDNKKNYEKNSENKSSEINTKHINYNEINIKTSKANTISNQSEKNKILKSKEFQTLKNQILQIKEKFNIDEDKIINFLEEDYEFPLSAYEMEELSSFELIVKFLKENKQLSNSQISQITNRKQKTIWSTYEKTKKKTSKKIIQKGETIPLSAIKNRTFSPLESVVSYLFDCKKMSLTKIARILKKNPKTIWTINNRRLNKC